MFADRQDAGRRLGEAVIQLGPPDPVVLGLPRGGVVVAAEVAGMLGAPLDVVVVRKLGAPGNPELGVGAIAEDGSIVINEALVARLGIGESELGATADRERRELQRRVDLYRSRPPLSLTHKTAIVVDDGLATGYTARAAVATVRSRGASRVVVAVPVAAPDVVAEFEELVDDVVCVERPPLLFGVGASYADFTQTSDEAVVAILSRHAAPGEVQIPCGTIVLQGDLTVPPGGEAIVVFAHGSGSSRFSPRNRAVATGLNDTGLGTLLFDLLTVEEAADRSMVFDIPLLADRLGAATDWLRRHRRARIGYFGSSTGAAAALWACADRDDIAAVVGRGGRPDLAGDRLESVAAPVRLIVGGRDTAVLDLNEAARRKLGGPADLVVVPGSGHLFEEPGALEQVTAAAAEWFHRWMAS